MPTPIRQGYGKRKRHLSSSAIVWNEAIDRSDSVSSASSQTLLSKSNEQILHANVSLSLPSEAPIQMMQGRRQPKLMRQPKATPPAPDVFDFDAEQSGRHLLSRKPKISSTGPARPSASPRVYGRKFLAKDSSSVREVVEECRKAPEPTISKENKGKGKLVESSIVPVVSDDVVDERFEMDTLTAIQSSRTTQPSPIEARGSSYNSRTSNKDENDTRIDTSTYVNPTLPPQPSASLRPVEVETSDPEIDLETQIRPRTPLLRVSSVVASPQPSPQPDVIYDILRDISTHDQLGKPPPRRLFHRSASMRGMSEVVEADSQSTTLELDGILEHAENKLVEQSQQFEVHDSEPDLSQYTTFEQSIVAETTEQRPARLTYSKQRSFLVEVPASDTIGRLSSPRPSAHDTDEDELTDGLPLRNIRNVHDLRQGGENKRFIDEASYLLEGLESPRTVLATVIELACKLFSKDFARKFRTADLERKIWSCCDTISDPASLFALTVIGSILHTESTRLVPNQINILRRSLQYDKDVEHYVFEKSCKASKSNKLSMMELRTQVAKSEAFSDIDAQQGHQISPRLLALLTMSTFTTSQISTGHLDDHVMSIVEGYRQPFTSQIVELQLISAILQVISPTRDLRSNETILLCNLVTSLTTLATTSNQISFVSGSLCKFFINRVTGRGPTLLLPDHFIIHLVKLITLRMGQTSHRQFSIAQTDENVLMLGLLISLIEESNDTIDLIRDTVSQNIDELLQSIKESQDQSYSETTMGYVALLIFNLFRNALTSGKNTVKPFDTATRRVIKSGLMTLKKALELDELQNHFTESLSTYANEL